MKFRLVTNGGELVANGTFDVTYISPPEVLVWGERLFVQDRTYDLRDRVVYREHWYVAVLESQIDKYEGLTDEDHRLRP